MLCSYLFQKISFLQKNEPYLHLFLYIDLLYIDDDDDANLLFGIIINSSKNSVLAHSLSSFLKSES